MDIIKATERYLRWHRSEGHSPKTLEWHTLGLGQFRAYLESQRHSLDIEDLASDDLRGFIDELRGRKLTQNSVATKARSVKAFGKWLVGEDYLSKDPFTKVSQPPIDKKAKETFTPEEVDRLLKSCDRKSVTGARDFAAMLLMFSTGLRASEVLGLQVTDIDSDKGLITVRRGKGGKFRVVPLGRPVERALERYLDHKQRPDHTMVFLSREGEPWSVAGLKAQMTRRGERVGVHCHAHKFRHSAAITYLRSGGRIETLKAMLGHTTLDMTLHYARIAGVDLTEAHATADPARSLKVRV